MGFQFPNTPSLGQTYTPAGGYQYVWDGTAWRVVEVSPGLFTTWKTYTPTLTGFGTATGVSVWSRKLGDTLELQGSFVCGTTTAVEARMTLGYDGTNANVTSDAAKVPSIQLAGPLVRSVALAGSFYLLIESNVNYVTFGASDATRNALGKMLGNALFATGQKLSFTGQVPITGW